MAIARNKRMETVHNGKVETVPNVRNEKTAIVRIVRSPIQKDSNLHNPVTATNNNAHVTTVRETITGRRGATMTVAETGQKNEERSQNSERPQNNEKPAKERNETPAQE